MVYSCLFGFGRLRCFCGSFYCFFFRLGFVFDFSVLFLFCCWIVFGVVLESNFFCFIVLLSFRFLATSPDPKPSLFSCFVVSCLFCFLFCSLFSAAFQTLLLIEKCFPPKRAILCIFLLLPLFLFSLFLASPFFTFSFFVSLLPFSFFLPSWFSYQFLVLAFCSCFASSFCLKMFF